MAYSANISFHGVSRVEIGEIKSLVRDGREPWECLTLWLYDANGRLTCAVPIHSDDNQPLAVEFERKREAA